MSWWKKIIYKENKGPTNGKRLTPQLKHEYRTLYTTLSFDDDRLDEIDEVCDIMIANKDKYTMVEKNTGMPKYLVGNIDNMESGMNPNCQLFNGQRWDKVTTIHPEGLGPWTSWKDAASDAMTVLKKQLGFTNLKEWTLPHILYAAEVHNGIGYRLWHHHQTLSPYIFGGSNHYRRGGYPRDHWWSSRYKCEQIGAATILKRLEQRGEIKW